MVDYLIFPRRNSSYNQRSFPGELIWIPELGSDPFNTTTPVSHAGGSSKLAYTSTLPCLFLPWTQQIAHLCAAHKCMEKAWEDYTLAEKQDREIREAREKLAKGRGDEQAAADFTIFRSGSSADVDSADEELNGTRNLKISHVPLSSPRS